MRRKRYNVGDRIFYECYGGSIESDIVISIEEQSYINDSGNTVNYQQLILWEEGGCSSCIENYSCLPENDPRCKDLRKKYRLFDRKKDKIVNSITNILSPWDERIQDEILKLVKLELTTRV